MKALEPLHKKAFHPDSFSDSRISPISTVAQNYLLQAVDNLGRQDLPFSTRVISYVRICSVIQQFALQNTERMPLSYSVLVSLLHSEDDDWWQHCYINQEHLISSVNQNIDALLQPLNWFVKKAIPHHFFRIN